MDIQTSIQQEQLPQIRRVATLDDVRRIVLPKKEMIPLQKSRARITSVVIGSLFFLVFGIELWFIYRYDKLNKRLYEIALSHKGRAMSLHKELKHTHKIVDKLVLSRKGLISNYLKMRSGNMILQYKIGNFKTISLAKSSMLDNLEGSLRVLNARIEAMDVQNEVLTNELKKKEEHIKELTAKLMDSIDEQEALVNENLMLKKQLAQQSAEVEDVSQ